MTYRYEDYWGKAVVLSMVLTTNIYYSSRAMLFFFSGHLSSEPAERTQFTITIQSSYNSHTTNAYIAHISDRMGSAGSRAHLESRL
jgi:hypothetical protein